MSDLDDSFAKLLGKQPNDAERQSLYRVRDALGLKNNDALWLVIIALQYYEGQYEKFPQAIAQAAKDTLVNFKVTADATVKASAEAAKADLAKAVAKAATDVAKATTKKQMLKWITICFVSITVSFGGIFWYVNERAYNSGYITGKEIGYSEARDEKAAFSWVNNSYEGKLALKLAKAGSIQGLATCNQPGWKTEKKNGKKVCAPYASSDGAWYGWFIE